VPKLPRTGLLDNVKVRDQVPHPLRRPYLPGGRPVAMESGAAPRYPGRQSGSSCRKSLNWWLRSNHQFYCVWGYSDLVDYLRADPRPFKRTYEGYDSRTGLTGNSELYSIDRGNESRDCVARFFAIGSLSSRCARSSEADLLCLAMVQRKRLLRRGCGATHSPARVNDCQFVLGFESANLRKNRRDKSGRCACLGPSVESAIPGSF